MGRRSIEDHSGFLGVCLAGLFVPLAGCGESGGSQPGIGREPLKTKVEDSAASIVATLAGRRTWPSRGVKVSLRSPNVVVTCRPGEGPTIVLHAWDANENDFNVPMLRMDWGDSLYQLTPEEFGALSRINEKKPRSP